MARLFETIPVDTDYEKSETLSMSPIVGINNFLKKNGLIPPASKISILPTAQISKPFPNVLITDMRNPWTNHRCADSPSSRIEILISNYYFARTTDKLPQNFTHKNPVYYKISLWKYCLL